MLPDTMHLADFFVRVLTEQIIGYYDPKTKVLYVVNGAPEEYVGITIMHELVHALQDQYVNLDSLEHITGDDDRATAVQAVIEGQATYEQVYIMAGGSGNVAAQLPGGWETMRSTIREAQPTQPVFSSAPMVIQETLLFPYINGAEFIRRYKAVHKAQLPIDTFPVSTEQLMHDSAYFAKQQDVPSLVTLAAGRRKSSTRTISASSGRGYSSFSIRATRTESIRASNGWDGDRYALVKTARRHRVRLGHRVGHAGRRRRIHVGHRRGNGEAILRQAARDRRAPAFRRRQAHRRGQRARGRRPAGRALRRRAGRLEHEHHRLLEGQGHAAVTVVPSAPRCRSSPTRRRGRRSSTR